MGAVWMRTRADLRARWRAWLALSLLIMVFFAPALTAFAGARRTQSAYPRFLEGQAAWDLFIFDGSMFADVLWKPQIEPIAALPYVEAVLAVTFVDAFGLNVIGDDAGEYGRTLNRAKIIEGRLPSKHAPDEVAVTAFQSTNADEPERGRNQRALADAKVGSTVTLRSPEGPSLDVKVVGRIVSPYDFPPNDFDAISLASPALMRRLKSQPGNIAFAGDALAVRFARPGDEARFDKDIPRITNGKAFNPLRQAVNASAVAYSARLQGFALALLAAAAGLTALLLLVQTLIRQSFLDSAEHPTLHALGMSHSELVVLSLIRTFLIAVTGASLAGSAAWLLSPMFPFGVFRQAETSPGMMFDAVPMVAIPLAIVVIALVTGAVPAWRSVSAVNVPALTRPSFLASVVARAGMRAPGVAGVRLALERGRGRTAVPVRSTIAIVSMGVAAMVVALTLSASITALLETPALYGRTWDKVVNFNVGPEGDVAPLHPGVVAKMAAQPEIEALALIDSGAPTLVDGRRVGSMVVGNVKGSLYPPILEGRAPSAPKEILLGSKTLRALGKKVDLQRPDTVTITLEGLPGALEGMQIVGRAAVPPIDLNARFGEGLVLAAGAPLQDLVGDEEVPEPTDALVKFTPGADQTALIERLAQEFPGLEFGDELAQGPADVVDFGRVQGTPLILAGVLALIGAASLTHALATAIRRRNRDLAILKTLGFTRGQVRRAVAWQASTLIVLSLMLGIPLGVVAGRQIWNVIAGSLGVVPSPRVPAIAIAILIPASVILANVIAAIPARAASRTRPGDMLRAE